MVAVWGRKFYSHREQSIWYIFVHCKVYSGQLEQSLIVFIYHYTTQENTVNMNEYNNSAGWLTSTFLVNSTI